MKLRKLIAVVFGGIGIYSAVLLLHEVLMPPSLTLLKGTLHEFSCRSRVRGDTYRIEIANQSGVHIFEGGEYDCFVFDGIGDKLGAKVSASYDNRLKQLRSLRVDGVLLLDERKTKTDILVSLAAGSILPLLLCVVFWQAKTW